MTNFFTTFAGAFLVTFIPSMVIVFILLRK
jgi:hypothetical protein